MKKNIVKLLLIISLKLIPTTCLCQTPFDSFAGFKGQKPMLENQQENKVFTVINTDSTSNVLFFTFDKLNNTVSYYSKSDTLLYMAKLNERNYKWYSIDPKAQKYVSHSPYNFVLNNPIRNYDPDGQEVWINYGDNQKVRYENGNLYNQDGSSYSGNDAFVGNVFSTLNSINSVKNGQTVVSGLVNSTEVFTFVNSAVPNSGGMAQMGFMPGKKEKGGTIYAEFLTTNKPQESKIDGTANELFNAFQQVSGEKGNNLNKEVASYLFSFGVTQSLYPEYNPQLGNPQTQAGQQFNQNMGTLLESQTFDPKLYSQTVKLFPNSGGIGTAYSNKGVPTKPNVKNPTISSFFPLVQPPQPAQAPTQKQ